MLLYKLTHWKRKRGSCSWFDGILDFRNYFRLSYCVWYEYCNALTKIFVEKLYITFTKLYKALKLDIFCIQRLYKSKFCMNVKKSYITFLHTYLQKCTKCTKLVQSLDQKKLESWNLCFMYIQTLYKLNKTYTTS